MKLVYAGGILTFGDEGGRRTVKGGEPFEVGDELAAILLADPNVSVADEAAASSSGEPDVPRETPLADKPKAQLLELAAELGLELAPRTTNAKIVEAIEAERQRLADEAAASSSGEGNQGGDATPGDDPDAAATGEPGTPPETGAVTLGDLPASARIGEQG